MRNLEAVPNTAGVYLIRNLINGKVYIGSSIEMYDRVIDHIWELTRGTHHNPHFSSSWLKYGPKSFEVEVLEQFDMDDRFELRLCEERWIAVYKATNRQFGYNLYATTVTPSDRICEETRARMSAAASARMQDPDRRCQIATWIKENGHSDEARTKISQAFKGRPQSEEHKAKRAAAQQGKPLSTEHRENIRQARLQLPDDVRSHWGRSNLGRQQSDEHRRKAAAARTGTKRSEETRARMSAARAAWWQRRKEQGA